MFYKNCTISIKDAKVLTVKDLIYLLQQVSPDAKVFYDRTDSNGKMLWSGGIEISFDSDQDTHIVIY